MASIGDVVYGGSPGEEFAVHTNVNGVGYYRVGTQLIMGDGRKFRYVTMPASSTTLVRGSLYQGAANTANHIGLTPTAAAIASGTLTVALGATAALANEYRHGYVHINQGAAGGSYYLVDGHPAVASSGSLTLVLANPVTGVAIPATAASIDLIHNKYWNPLLVPTTKTNAPCGVAMTALTAGQSGWMQTAGPCSVLTQGTVVIGNYVITSGTTAGAVAPAAGSGAASENEIGVVMRVGGSGAWSLINLELDN